jgi:hypothetical protein
MKLIFKSTETCLMSGEFKSRIVYLPGIPALNHPASP